MNKNVKYFEVDMESTKDQNAGTYSICIKGMRKPNIEEAKLFLKSDMENLGYDSITFINETTLEEAKNFYNMEKEDDFPIFK